MFHSSYLPSSTLLDFKFYLWFAINCLANTSNDKIYKNTVVENTNIISGALGGCGGGGRKCSCRCTTAAIIFIFKNITTDDKTLSNNISESTFSSILTNQCVVTFSQRDNLNFYSFKYQCNAKCVVIVCKILLINNYYNHNQLPELKLKQQTTTISIQKTSETSISNMISPASTCMGTIHKYYEKIKDAVDDTKP